MSLCGSAFTDVVPRPLGETVHGTAPNEVVHFDYLHVGESGPQASQGLPEDGGFRYILVIMHDLSNFVSRSLWWFVPPKQLLSLC